MESTLAPLDYLAIGAWLLLAAGIGFLFRRRAGLSPQHYFLAGRALPWWLAGPSMLSCLLAFVAPAAFAVLTRRHGVSGSWLWWSLGIPQVAAVFLFSRLWHRSGVTSDNELLELRYSGRAASGLRVAKAVVLGGLLNILLMGLVIRLAAELFPLLLPVGPTVALVACIVIAVACAVLSGMYGVVALDLVLLVVSAAGSIALAVAAVDGLGGIDVLFERMIQTGGQWEGPFDLFPAAGGDPGGPFAALLVLVLVAWWANPFADGSGMMAQRLVACRTERQSALAALFSALTGLIRSWPWIVAALVSLVLFPSLVSVPQGDVAALPLVADLYLGAGAKGLLVVAFLAAFVCTLAAQLSWGASYLVNDVYRRFPRPEAGVDRLVRVAGLVQLGLVSLAALIALSGGSFRTTFTFAFLAGAGLGLVLLLRWFWWRVSAVTEIAALSCSVLLAGVDVLLTVLQPDLQVMGRPYAFLPVHVKVLAVVPVSLGVALAATFLSRPVPKDVLERFYRQVRPGGVWGVLPREVRAAPDRVLTWRFMLDWAGGMALVFGTASAIGAALSQEWLALVALSALAAVGGGWTAVALIRLPGSVPLAPGPEAMDGSGGGETRDGSDDGGETT